MNEPMEPVALWIARYADNDLLVTVYPDHTVEVAPRLDHTRWDAPLRIRQAPGWPPYPTHEQGNPHVNAPYEAP